MSAEFSVEHLRPGWDYKFVLITNYLSALTVEALNIPGCIVDEYKSKGIDLTMELVATKKSL